MRLPPSHGNVKGCCRRVATYTQTYLVVPFLFHQRVPFFCKMDLAMFQKPTTFKQIGVVVFVFLVVGVVLVAVVFVVLVGLGLVG